LTVPGAFLAFFFVKSFSFFMGDGVPKFFPKVRCGAPCGRFGVVESCERRHRLCTLLGLLLRTESRSSVVLMYDLVPFCGCFGEFVSDLLKMKACLHVGGVNLGISKNALYGTETLETDWYFVIWFRKKMFLTRLDFQAVLEETSMVDVPE